MRMLAARVSRWLCLWFIRFGCFCSRSKPLVKLAIVFSFLYCCCDLCIQSRGCPGASHDWVALLLFAAAASCLLHGRQMLPPSSFLSAVRCFCCRRCAVLRSAVALARYVIKSSSNQRTNVVTFSVGFSLCAWSTSRVFRAPLFEVASTLVPRRQT